MRSMKPARGPEYRGHERMRPMHFRRDISDSSVIVFSWPVIGQVQLISRGIRRDFCSRSWIAMQI